MKVSSKRQVTFPKQVCESLGIHPGDEILLERHVDSGEEVWYLKPAKEARRPWLGSLRKYGHNKKHDLDAIRESILQGRKNNRS